MSQSAGAACARNGAWSDAVSRNKLVPKLILEVIEVDVSAGDVPAAADRIADRLEASGGLWLDDGEGYPRGEELRP